MLEHDKLLRKHHRYQETPGSPPHLLFQSPKCFYPGKKKCHIFTPKENGIEKDDSQTGLAIEFVLREPASCSKQIMFNLNPVLTMIGLDEAHQIHTQVEHLIFYLMKSVFKY